MSHKHKKGGASTHQRKSCRTTREPCMVLHLGPQQYPCWTLYGDHLILLVVDSEKHPNRKCYSLNIEVARLEMQLRFILLNIEIFPSTPQIPPRASRYSLSTLLISHTRWPLHVSRSLVCVLISRTHDMRCLSGWVRHRIRVPGSGSVSKLEMFWSQRCDDLYQWQIPHILKRR